MSFSRDTIADVITDRLRGRILKSCSGDVLRRTVSSTLSRGLVEEPYTIVVSPLSQEETLAERLRDDRSWREYLSVALILSDGKRSEFVLFVGD